MDDHLSKPFTFDQLSEVLARYLPFERVGLDVASHPVHDEPHRKRGAHPGWAA